MITDVRDTYSLALGYPELTWLLGSLGITQTPLFDLPVGEAEKADIRTLARKGADALVEKGLIAKAGAHDWRVSPLLIQTALVLGSPTRCLLCERQRRDGQKEKWAGYFSDPLVFSLTLAGSCFEFTYYPENQDLIDHAFAWLQVPAQATCTPAPEGLTGELAAGFAQAAWNDSTNVQNDLRRHGLSEGSASSAAAWLSALDAIATVNLAKWNGEQMASERSLLLLRQGQTVWAAEYTADQQMYGQILPFCADLMPGMSLFKTA